MLLSEFTNLLTSRKIIITMLRDISMINKKHIITMLNQQSVLSCNAKDIDFAEEIVKKSFIKVFNDHVSLPNKTILKNEDSSGQINIMPCVISADTNNEAIYGVKLAGFNENNVQKKLPSLNCIIALFNHETQQLNALLNGDIITAYRTAAVTRLIARYTLQPDKIKNVLLIGAGVHMKIHLIAMNIFFNENVKVGIYSRGDSKYAFVKEMKQKTSSHLWAIDTLDDNIISSADVIVGCIPNNDINKAPIKKANLKKGVVFFNIGGYDCDIDTICNMEKYYTDIWDMVKHRGEVPICDAYASGKIKKEHIKDIPAFIANNRSMREKESDKILVSLVGLSSHDILFANEIYKRSIDKQLGTQFELSHSLFDTFL